MMDRSSPTWVALRREIMNRIEKLRSDLEVIGIDPAPIRGEIAGLRWALSTVEPDVPIERQTDYLQVRNSDPS